MAFSEEQTRVSVPLKRDALVRVKERLAVACTPLNNRKTSKILLPPPTKLREGNVVIGVSHSVRGDGVGTSHV